MKSKAIRYRRKVVPADVENVRNIVASSGFFSIEEIEVAVELVQERLANGARSGYEFMFAEHAGEAIGYTCFGRIPGTMASYDLYWIAVHSEHRGKGIGKKLLQKTERQIATQGGRRVYVDTSSRQQYEPTRSFYQRCGYKEEAVLRDFYSPGDGKVIYVKEIAPSVPDVS